MQRLEDELGEERFSFIDTCQANWRSCPNQSCRWSSVWTAAMCTPVGCQKSVICSDPDTLTADDQVKTNEVFVNCLSCQFRRPMRPANSRT